MDQQIKAAISAVEAARIEILKLQEKMDKHPQLDAADDAELALFWAIRRLEKIDLSKQPKI
jgi:hypothetical protein